MDLKEENILLESVLGHWYYQSKTNAVLKLIKNIPINHILDIGAGSGFFSKQLLLRTDANQADCIDKSYNFEKEEITGSKKINFWKQFKKSNADFVLLMDILEHIENDASFLKEQILKTSPGAYFLITVPAYSFLWSGHDEFLEHKRRYTLKKLESLVKDSGLQIEKTAYYFGLILPIVIIVRMLGKWKKNFKEVQKSDLKQYSKFTNIILSLICRFELLLFPHKLAGLSVFCLARKIPDMCKNASANN
jgi:2-polyprenyl-3-methyl-5-hydroxy-6-metoxy-1,4-benzoquinol methylase